MAGMWLCDTVTLSRCYVLINVTHEPIMHAKMGNFLCTSDNDETADWWKEHQTGPWTSSDCWYAPSEPPRGQVTVSQARD